MADKENPLITEIESQIKTMEDRRLRWEGLWRDVIEFCCPMRRFDPIKDQDADKKPKVNYNNRAALDLERAAASFLGYTANRRSLWHKIGFEDQNLHNEYGVTDWTESADRGISATFSRDGFYEALGEIGPDYISIGTAVVYIEEIGNGSIAYQARHPLSVWIAENAVGQVDTVLEDIPFANRAVLERFGEGVLSDDRRKKATDKPYEITKIRHLVKPMDERFRTYAQVPFDSKMPYMSVWWDPIDKSILDVGGYWEFPYCVGRCLKNAGEEYGRSWGQNALGDIMVAQQMTKSRIKLSNTIADPAYLVDEGLEGQDTLLPGSRIYRSKKARADTIEPIIPAGSYPITADNEKRQDDLIDAHFHLDIFQMLQMLDQRNMTAREVIERTGERASTLGPTVGRFEREILQPAIIRTFGILYRAGKLPPAPEAIRNATTAAFKIDFLGYLAQVLQRYYSQNGINAGFAFAAQVIQAFPEARDWVDGDRLIVEGMESSAMPASIIREKQDVEKLRAQRLAQQQAQAEQEQAQAQDELIAQNADKLGKKIEQGSPLEGIAQAAEGGQQ